MKYETPEVVALPNAINAIQSIKQQGGSDPHDNSPAYEDYE